MDFFNKDGHLNTAGFALYSDALKLKKKQDLPEGITSHILNCKECQVELVDFTSILTDVDQPALADHPFFKTESPKVVKLEGASSRKWLYRLAAAAIIGILILFSYQQFFLKKGTDEIVKTDPEKEMPKEENKNIEESIIVQKEESPIPEKRQRINTLESPELNEENKEQNEAQFLASFIPNEEMESLVGTVYRSELIKINEPKNNASFGKGQEILFIWENNNSVKLTIFDNEENIILEKDNAISPFTSNNHLNPGLYYWRLETEQDFLHLGRFEVSVE